MLLYFDNTRTLKTIIPHGEPCRQGDTLTLEVLFDKEVFMVNNVDVFDQCTIGFRYLRPGEDKFSALIPFEERYAEKVFNRIDEKEFIGALEDGEEYTTVGIGPSSANIQRITDKNGELKITILVYYGSKVLVTSQTVINVEDTLGLKPNEGLGMTQSQYNALMEAFENVLDFDFTKIFNPLTAKEIRDICEDEIIGG